VKSTFSVAEFSPVSLIARLESHASTNGKLKFRLRVMALRIPYAARPSWPCNRASWWSTRKRSKVRMALVEASSTSKSMKARSGANHHAGRQTPASFFPGTAKTER